MQPLWNWLYQLTSFFAFFTMLQLFCKSLVPVWITTMSGFLRIAGLMWSIRSSVDAPGWGRILTESPRDTSLPLTFFIIESLMTTMFFFTFGWWASGWRSWSSLNLSSLGTFDSSFYHFVKRYLYWYVWYLYHLSFSWLSDFEQRRFEPELYYCYAQGWNRIASAYSLCHLSVVYFHFPKA